MKSGKTGKWGERQSFKLMNMETSFYHPFLELEGQKEQKKLEFYIYAVGKQTYMNIYMSTCRQKIN